MYQDVLRSRRRWGSLFDAVGGGVHLHEITDGLLRRAEMSPLSLSDGRLKLGFRGRGFGILAQKMNGLLCIRGWRKVGVWVCRSSARHQSRRVRGNDDDPSLRRSQDGSGTTNIYRNSFQPWKARSDPPPCRLKYLRSQIVPIWIGTTRVPDYSNDVVV